MAIGGSGSGGVDDFVGIVTAGAMVFRDIGLSQDLFDWIAMAYSRQSRIRSTWLLRWLRRVLWVC